MSAKKYLAGVLVLTAGVAGFAVLRSRAHTGAQQKLGLGYAAAENSPSAQAEDVGAPETVRPEVKAEGNTLRLTGSLVADQKSEVASTANGIVKEVRVECGSLVEKGDVLVKVDPKDAENNLKEGLAMVAGLRAALGWEEGQGAFDAEQQPEVCAAKASLGLAKTNFDRYSSLLAQQAVQQAVFDQAKTQYETAQQQYEQSLRHAQQLYQSLLTALARVDILEKAVADTTIKAPFSGWIAAKYVSEGERVATTPMGTGSKVVSLVSVDPLRLVLTVPQQDAAVVHQGQQVTFTVETFPDQKFAGEVKYIAPSLETDSRSLSVEAMVANKDKVLRPGFFASAELALPGTIERLMLPASAVVKVGEVSKVYVLRDGQAIERVVDVAEIQGDRVIVKSGITADDAVIVSPDTLPKTDEVKP